MSYRISKNFSTEEFTCRCGCGRWAANTVLIRDFEKSRKHFGNRPLVITPNGGFRCNGNWKRADWNHHCGGADMSYHSTGGAGDHYIVGVPLQDLYDYYDETYPTSRGVMLYGANGFVHFDCRLHQKYRKIVSQPR